jgi:hypothetical protein
VITGLRAQPILSKVYMGSTDSMEATLNGNEEDRMMNDECVGRENRYENKTCVAMWIMEILLSSFVILFNLLRHGSSIINNGRLTEHHGQSAGGSAIIIFSFASGSSDRIRRGRSDWGRRVPSACHDGRVFNILLSDDAGTLSPGAIDCSTVRRVCGRGPESWG